MQTEKGKKIIERFRTAAVLMLLLLSAAAGLFALRNDPSGLLSFTAGASEREETLASRLPFRTAFLTPYRGANTLLQRRFFPEHSIYIREDGFLEQGSRPQKADHAITQITGLQKYCEETGRHFLYVIFPGKPQADTDLTQLGIPCYRNAIADEMKEKMRAAGISVLDTRPLYAEDFDSYFYKTDHHWNADAGLLAAGEILRTLNTEFGYSFDTDALSPSHFEREVIADAMFGEMGRKTLGQFLAREDLVVLRPKDTFRLRYSDLPRNKTLAGDFDILTDPARLQKKDQETGSAYYYYLSENNSLTIENADAKEGDLFIIKDSFSNAVLPFLSLETARITAWDLREDPGIYTYLDAHPEIETVIIAYNISFMPTSRTNAFEKRASESAPGFTPETLDRGLIALNVPDGVFLSWRLFGTEDPDTVFQILRNGEVIAELSDRTNYTDPGGSISDHYSVLPAGSDMDSDPETPVLATPYLSIPLTPPDGGVGEDGISYTYAAGDAAFADLNGDGAYEIILKWDPSNAFDSGEAGQPTGNVFIDAYTLSGKRLWRMDLGCNIPAGPHFTQIAAYDLDLDGKAEVALKTAPGSKDGQGRYVTAASLDAAIRNADNEADLRHTEDGGDSHGRALAGDEYFTVFDGETGAALDTVFYPHPRGTVSEWGDDRGNRSERYLSAIAYLDGKWPHVVTWRGYYGKTTAAAYRLADGRLVQTADFDTSEPGNAQYAGQGNHFLSVGDADGDGNDELFCGSLALDDDLSVLWCSGRGHGDAQHLGDLDPTRPGLEYFSVHETGTCGMTVYAAESGQELFHTDAAGDTRRGMAAHCGYTDGYYEIFAAGGFSDTEETGGLTNAVAEGRDIAAFASYGKSDFREADFTPASVNFRIYWDGDLYDDLLDGTISEDAQPLPADEDAGARQSAAAASFAESRVRIDNKDGLIEILPDGVTINGSKNNVCLAADILGDWREEIVIPSSDSTALYIYSTTIPTAYKLPTLMHDRTYRLQAAAQNSGYNQPPHTGYYLS